MCCWMSESWGKAWTWSGESVVYTIIQCWRTLFRPVTHSWTNCRRTPRQQRYPTLASSLKYPLENMKIDLKQHFETTRSSLTSNKQVIITPDLTMFTNIASSLALSSLILGSLQQCGELLRREPQDDSTLGVLPCIRALYQGLQGKDDKQRQHLWISPHFSTDRVQFSRWLTGKFPGLPHKEGQSFGCLCATGRGA